MHGHIDRPLATHDIEHHNRLNRPALGKGGRIPTVVQPKLDSESSSFPVCGRGMLGCDRRARLNGCIGTPQPEYFIADWLRFGGLVTNRAWGSNVPIRRWRLLKVIGEHDVALRVVGLGIEKPAPVGRN